MTAIITPNMHVQHQVHLSGDKLQAITCHIGDTDSITDYLEREIITFSPISRSGSKMNFQLARSSLKLG